jgi:hypothetical protein
MRLYPSLMMLTAVVCVGCGSLDFGDNPSKPVEKTERRLTAPPTDLQNGTAIEAPALTRRKTSTADH